MSSEKTKPLDKPRLTEDSLREHGIFYDERVYKGALENEDSLPNQVNNLRKCLLQFSQTIHPEYKERFVQCTAPDPPKDAWVTLPAVGEPEKKREADARINTDKSITTAASFEALANSAEREWTQDLVEHLFKPFRCSHFSAGNDRLSEWRTAQDLHWNEFSTWSNMDEYINRRRPLTGPKPDITYGFPIYRPDEDLPPVLAASEDAQMFSYGFLRGLCSGLKPELRSTPTTGLNGVKKVQDLKDHQLLCYPWAVVEVKHAKVPPGDIKFCYRQAANAAHAALAIQASLYRASHKYLSKSEPLGFPPIVAFTFVGPRIRVWLAYTDVDSNPNTTKMRCIYSTNLRWPWGVYSTRLIIQNMQIWATRNLRQTISRCLLLVPIVNNGRIDAEPEDASRTAKLRPRVTLSPRPPHHPASSSRATPDADVPMSPIDAPIGLFRMHGGNLAQQTTLRSRSSEAGRGRTSETARPLEPIHEDGAYLTENDRLQSNDRKRANSKNNGAAASRTHLAPRPIHKRSVSLGERIDDSSKIDGFKSDDSESDDSESDDSESDDSESDGSQYFDSGSYGSYESDFVASDLEVDNSGDSWHQSDSSDSEDEGSIVSAESTRHNDEDERYVPAIVLPSSIRKSMANPWKPATIIDDFRSMAPPFPSRKTMAKPRKPVTTNNDSFDVRASSNSRRTMAKPRKAATTDDVPELLRRTLEELDGSVFITLPTFQEVVKRSPKSKIVDAIDMCLFVTGASETSLRLRKQPKETLGDAATHGNTFRTVLQELDPEYDGVSRGWRHLHSIQTALWNMYSGEDIRCIWNRILSCYKGHHIIDVMTREGFTIARKEWRKMEEEAMDIDLRKTRKNMRRSVR